MARASALTPPRIDDGRKGRGETPGERSRVFRLKVEESRVLPDVVIGTYRVYIFFFIVYVLDYAIVCE